MTAARPLVALLVCVAVFGSGCTKKKEPPRPVSDEAGYFFARRDLLRPAPPDLAGSLRVGLPSFSQPSGRRPAPGEPDLGLQLSVSYQGQGPQIVILDVIPWRIGDVQKGPGARLTKTKRYGLSISPGESAAVDVPVIMERVGGPPTSGPGGPPGGGSGLPGPTPGPPTQGPGTPRSLGTGTLAAARQVAQPTPQPTPSVAPRPQPSGSPGLGPTLPSPGSPFDPASGLQVILVAAFVGEGVPPDAFAAVRLVPDDAFAAEYGRYFRVEQGIPVATDRIL